MPGVCRDCRAPLVWFRGAWRDRMDGEVSAPHVCGMVPVPVTSNLCGRWMRYAKERCARSRGHAGDHRTRYAMDNALQAATGRRRAA